MNIPLLRGYAEIAKFTRQLDLTANRHRAVLYEGISIRSSKGSMDRNRTITELSEDASEVSVIKLMIVGWYISLHV